MRPLEISDSFSPLAPGLADGPRCNASAKGRKAQQEEFPYVLLDPLDMTSEGTSGWVTETTRAFYA